MLSRDLKFDQLCLLNPHLSQFYDFNKKKFDFNSQDALVQLTQTLIKLDLGYTVKLSTTYLCPSYFNRLDYVIFIKNLLELTSIDNDFPIYGLDIGTSQSCIYPLICTKYLKTLSKMIATDIVPQFIESAKTILQSNKLEDQIEPILVDSKRNSFLMISKRIPENSIVFTMCNPPFYSSEMEMERARLSKLGFQKNKTIGHNSELFTEGGDFKFILKLLTDSKSFGHCVTWFTSLIGNHSTLIRLIPFLKKMEMDGQILFGIHRFKSGKFTTRWIIFWTFNKVFKPPLELFNYSNKKVNSNKLWKKLRGNSEYNSVKLRYLIINKLTSLPYILLQIKDVIIISLPGNVFSRAYRRSKTFINDGSVYIFEISIESGKIIFRNGSEYQVFESFCNVINSCIE